jgi:cytochrome c oxidase subunit II
MQQGFQLFPRQASTFAPHVDNLYLFLIGMSVFFSVLISVAILVLAIKYRRTPGRNAVQVEDVMGLEILWTAMPALLTLGIFVWSSSLFMDQSIPPKGAHDISVVGQRWMWKVQHSNGRREINELHVPSRQAVKLTLTSQDVIHSFYVPAFRKKQDAIPGQYRTLWFEATTPGEYHLFCAEYCGTNHSRMTGRIVVMNDVDYQAWLGGGMEATPVERGKQLFTQFDCASCHESGERQRCPTLGGLYGTQVELDDGRKVLFDESYVRESVLDPNAKIAKGFPPLMPSFRGQVSEEQMLDLIAYIKSIAPSPQREVVGGSNR